MNYYEHKRTNTIFCSLPEDDTIYVDFYNKSNVVPYFIIKDSDDWELLDLEKLITDKIFSIKDFKDIVIKMYLNKQVSELSQEFKRVEIELLKLILKEQ